MIFVFCCIICICNFQSSEEPCSIAQIPVLTGQHKYSYSSWGLAACSGWIRMSCWLWLPVATYWCEGERQNMRCFIRNYWTLTFSLKILLQQACHLEINRYATSNAYWLFFFLNQLMYHLSWTFTDHDYMYWSLLSSYKILLVGVKSLNTDYFVRIYHIMIWKPWHYFS